MNSKIVHDEVNKAASRQVLEMHEIRKTVLVGSRSLYKERSVCVRVDASLTIEERAIM